MPARRTCLVFAVIFTWYGGTCSIAMAEEIINHQNSVKDARDLLFSELASRDPEVRREAIRMLRYEGSDRAFDAVRSLFREFEGYLLEPGSPMWQDDAVDTIYAIDPEATLAWLLLHNDEVLARFDLYRLFSAIGFEAMPSFDNLFWHLMQQEGPWNDLLGSIVLQEMYAATGNEIYGSVVAFPVILSTKNPEVYARQMSYRIQRGLSVDPIYHAFAWQGGLDPVVPIVSRSYTLSEMLFQALLFRFGFADEVYRTTLEAILSSVRYSTQAEDKHGVTTERLTFARDLGDLAAFPILVVNDAIAHLYAGAPRTGDAAVILDGIAGLTAVEKARYASIILDSPPTAVRFLLVRAFAESSSSDIRRLVLTRLVDEPPLFALSTFETLLISETDPRCIAALVKLIGAYEADSTLGLLTSLLDHERAIVRCAAAGQILRIAESGR